MVKETNSSVDVGEVFKTNFQPHHLWPVTNEFYGFLGGLCGLMVFLVGLHGF